MIQEIQESVNPDHIPGMLVRMRCPACQFDYRFIVPVNMQLEDLPEVTKQVMSCRCDNHIPKINKNTPIMASLMSINAVPLRDLLSRNAIKKNFSGEKPNG